MSPTSDVGFFGKTVPTEVLELLVDEVAGSLSLLSPFHLEGIVADDEIVNDRPGSAQSVRIAVRFGFKTPHGSRMGFLLMELKDAMTLAGSLLMLPNEELQELMTKPEPSEGEKEALMEAGELLGGAFHNLLKKRLPEDTAVRFFGCQGVSPGDAPWVASYGGEPLAVRRQLVQFGSFDPFELMIAIPA